MKLITVIFLFIYSVSTFVGIGVLRCGCTHSQRIVMMSVHSSCLCNGSLEKCCRHNDHFHEDDEEDDCENDCCSLEYQYVDVDQLNTKHAQNRTTKILSLLFFPLLSDHGLSAGFKENTIAVNNNSPPPDIFKIPIIYMHGQLRL